MRCATTTLLLASALSSGQASACPDMSSKVSTDDGPATSSPCMRGVDFSAVRRAIEVRYALGAGGSSQTATGRTLTSFATLEAAYATQYGGDATQASYEVELSGGVTAQYTTGDVSATGLVTQASGRVGPARVNPAVVDEGRANMAWFPLSLEVAHVGELAARPRLSSRPEVSRALYDRERVSLSTRLLRLEGAGDKTPNTAPGLTEPKKPTSWGLDVIPLHTALDVAMQGTTRVETTIGGSMLGVTEHTNGMSIDVFGIEHRRIDRTMAETTDLDTLWVLRLDGVNPHTGTRYYAGWGEVIDMPDSEELGRRLDPENGNISIGGIGWFSSHSWGGWGAQYKREPFVTMTGAVGLEDRFSVEVFVPRALGIVMRAFAARTTRLVDDELQHDGTAGVEVDASYTRNGFTSRLGLEAGRTFYSALDGTLPQSTGFAAGAGLTIQHSGARTWTR